MQRNVFKVFQISAIFIVLAAAALYVLNFPVLYRQLQQVCDTCAITGSIQGELESLGWSASGYGLYLLFLSVSFAFGNVFLGIFIFRKRFNDPMALLVAVCLAIFGLTLTVSESFYLAYPFLSHFSKFINFIALLLMGAMICYFPDFRTTPRLNHFLAGSYLLVELLGHFLTLEQQELIFPDWLYHPLEWTILLVMGASQMYRYRRLSTPIQRQQVKLPIYAFTMAVLFVIISVQMPLDGLWGNLLGQTLYFIALSIIPISFAIAIIRYKLWAIDSLINRTILYGALSGILLAIYGSAIFIFGAAFQAEGTTFAAIMGTIAVAILVQPLHNRLQKIVNRLMYGDRQDPYAALVRLGNRLEVTTTSELVLDAIVSSVRDALHLSYVALVWPNGEIAAESGNLEEGSKRLDVVYQGEQVAELVFTSMEKEDEWSNADQQIMNDLCRQAGAAVHAVRLTQELQRSRQTLVTTREDERRRLRRDLHDGLGPEIAAFSFRVATARHLLRNEPEQADQILSDLQVEIRNAVDLIRQLAHNLRPPVLDEYGLAAAIGELVRINRGAGIEITLHIPSPLPVLDAAVEVAAYRIVQEGLGNAIRHAQASEILLELALKEEMLILQLADNGLGLPKVTRPGVGLASMRERSEELGGTFTIMSRIEGGTLIRAEIPNYYRGEQNVKSTRPTG
ncbi:histidine kinase/DNA gyrase B/HSP90-like ATPase [Bacillus oleivorans]|uniref:histidine kinase n=1 Tax=Bacillus oleivorans TaxID=1448271 RepID=A0A285CT43_9BACI|nr:GAF domain-containing sensor histidine kinase [Bacillus oleivorans]SNX70737.1 histidine kinase/DNA gyrase B/HSP90-like ATPase [Bacillus oleivorans]